MVHKQRYDILTLNFMVRLNYKFCPDFVDLILEFLFLFKMYIHTRINILFQILVEYKIKSSIFFNCPIGKTTIHR